MFLAILFAFLVGIIGYWYYLYFYYYGYLKKIPTPKMWPLLGNSLEFRERDALFQMIENNMKKLKSKSIRIHVPTRTLVITKDYKLIEHILGSSTLINKGFEYRFFKNWIGLSLFNAGGQIWRSKRKMLTPTFHFQILERFHDVFNQNAAIMVDKLRKHVGEKSVDVFPFVNNCSLDIICETAMGTSINAQSDASVPYCKAIHRMSQIVPMRITNPLYHSDFLYGMTDLCKEEQALLKTIHGYQDNIIRSRRQKYIESQKNGSNNADTDELGRKKKIPFLDLLFQATIDGQPLTDKEISDEVSTFMVAGHDTTSGAISFGLYLLANHPEIQQKAIDELQEIFGDDKQRPATMSDIQDMHFLDLIIKETLRLYPSAPLFTRYNNQEFTVDGITYPAGITISIFAYGMHHDEDIYENANTFDPERFCKERFDGKKPYAYIPFSAGPRNCIGQKYASLEMKTLMSIILRNFVLKPASPLHVPQVLPNVILRSANGIKLAFEERK